MRVVWSEKARNALADIYDYVYQDSPETAEKVLETLVGKATSLEDKRIEYPRDPILNDERFRFIIQWDFKILYQRTESEVIILDIFHTRKDPGKLTI
ncbi:type II toxin-antitoxin system RelE/ParE family toxin [Rhodohalobacter sulfatireducens]|uniref:Type II toxin-antitoxin system RelE/ParE family toxin n=1 Tax=Rhodohalobacter sulfatireducens TaxID=2911366 RepID=A0ABS9KJU2_9BACT|nr:type II toxin-antitoxin system RelE/ParE family toxin [Rhodohalobacter sulfatireducens]MCG2591125.1 type II toxin-antitoxin system RelE/ParE family toxin [Rhodohalobacter sulfatireducens]